MARALVPTHGTRALTIALLLLWAGRAGAPPPLGSFPAALAPTDGASAPPNASVWAFGTGAPPPSGVAVVVTADEGPIAGEVARLGCCLLRFSPAAPLVVGTTVDAWVSSPGGERAATFAVGGAADVVSPTLSPPAVLEDAGGRLVLGIEADDDVAVAGALALVGGEVVSGAPGDALLTVDVEAGGCVDVVAIDLAGNESDAREVCAETSEPGPDGGPGSEPPPFGCASSSSSSTPWPLAGLALGLALARRGRRRCGV